MLTEIKLFAHLRKVKGSNILTLGLQEEETERQHSELKATCPFIFIENQNTYIIKGLWL